MGLKGVLKKKSKSEEKHEEIGGLNLADKFPAESKNSLPPAQAKSPAVANPSTLSSGPSKPSAEGQQPPPKKDEKLSSLDIFEAESMEEDEGGKLAKQLPDIAINDLLLECNEIAALLKQNITS